MMAESAARADSQGPRGFSLASILMVPGGRTLAAAWASMGSVTMRRARAAEASEDPCKNERREKRRARIGEFSWRIGSGRSSRSRAGRRTEAEREAIPGGRIIPLEGK